MLILGSGFRVKLPKNMSLDEETKAFSETCRSLHGGGGG